MSKLTDIHEKIEETIKNLVKLELLFNNLNTEYMTNENKDEIEKEFKIKSQGYTGYVANVREKVEMLKDVFDTRMLQFENE
jgi:hypothetical protein